LTIKNGIANWCINNNEDYGTYILYGLPQAPFTSENILTEVDAEIVKLQTELISDKELQNYKTNTKTNT
jgi:hypothetical protein